MNLWKLRLRLKTIAFVGNYLPRKCGIATFTSDLLNAVTARYPQTQSFAVPVNDVEEGYEYPSVVRFEIEEQDLSSYQRAADFINISNVDSGLAYNTSSGFSAGRQEVTCGGCCAN